ncbi:MAG: Vms1/Ankzf1 family peptidyl-tRNA hydrolase [Halococcoides sp.]
MLDDLLGRTALKDRIADLEAERDDLEDELDAERERRSAAVTARQDAEERINRLEDRIADLEGQLDRHDETTNEPQIRHDAILRGEQIDAMLDRLESFRTGPEATVTAYVDDGPVAEALRVAFGDRWPLVDQARPCLAVTDDRDLVGATLSVPLPPEPFVTFDDRVQIKRSWFAEPDRYTLAVVRSDLFAMGRYEDGERTGFRGFDADLMENHSKGGFSQARFERRRDEQIDTHLDRCRAVLDELDAEHLSIVGEQAAIGELAAFADDTATSDARGSPEEALATARRDRWAVEYRAV